MALGDTGGGDHIDISAGFVRVLGSKPLKDSWKWHIRASEGDEGAGCSLGWEPSDISLSITDGIRR